MSDAVLFERDGNVVTLTINRPETRNALSDDVVSALTAACTELSRDHSVRAVVLTGAGPHFCAGGNIKDMRDRTGLFAGDPAEMRDNYRTGIQQIPLALYEFDIPTVAAVNGSAIGAGCDLATMCDIRIAGESTRFAESFVKLGIIPGDGGSWLLPRAVGLSRACEMTFTGVPIDSLTAEKWGLVSRVVADDLVLSEAQQVAARIAENPPEVLRMSKRLIREGQRTELRTLLEMSAAFQTIAQQLPDHHEAVSAMMEKRKPGFKGRG